MASQALRSAKPRLTLSVPSATGNGSALSPAAVLSPASALRRAGAHTKSAPKSPFPMPVSPAPMSSPTARNTWINQRGGLANPYTSYMRPRDQAQRASFMVLTASQQAAYAPNPAGFKSAMKRGSISSASTSTSTRTSASKSASASILSNRLSVPSNPRATMSTSAAVRVDAVADQANAMRRASKLRVKSIAFDDAPAIRTVSPLPQDYYGTYHQLSKEERRWVSLM